VCHNAALYIIGPRPWTPGPLGDFRSLGSLGYAPNENSRLINVQYLSDVCISSFFFPWKTHNFSQHWHFKHTQFSFAFLFQWSRFRIRTDCTIVS